MNNTLFGDLFVVFFCALGLPLSFCLESFPSVVMVFMAAAACRSMQSFPQ